MIVLYALAAVGVVALVGLMTIAKPPRSLLVNRPANEITVDVNLPAHETWAAVERAAHQMGQKTLASEDHDYRIYGNAWKLYPPTGYYLVQMHDPTPNDPYHRHLIIGVKERKPFNTNTQRATVWRDAFIGLLRQELNAESFALQSEQRKTG